MHFNVIIVGAGAAGLMCAIEAGKRGRSVLLLDAAKAVGEKIRISGGGRCNFTNIHTSPANYLSRNPHFCVSALKRYTPSDFIALVTKHGIAYHEKTLGQLFCDESSKQIIAMLLAECEAAKVQIQLNTHATKIDKSGDGFDVALSDGKSHTADSLVIATGGPSIPKMGATGWGYDIAKQFGLKIVPPRAGLVPFTLDEVILKTLRPLAGISLPVIASCGEISFAEGMLFTHRGLSGPSILQISSYWRDGDEIRINFVPDVDLLALLKELRESGLKQEVKTVLAKFVPQKLAQYICDEGGFSGRLAECSNKTLEAITDVLQRWTIIPNGTEGYRTAEVTLGGVDVEEISSKTFETHRVPGLYFIGEVIDVTGHLGGFNFQWAWASGFASGQVV